MRNIKLTIEYDGTAFEVFNIGSGLSYSVDEIVRNILEIWGQKVEVHYQHLRRKNEIMNVVADIKKAKEKLDWQPKVSIEDGLALTISQNRQHLESLH